MDVIIITGLSGAGKSQAAHCMEDLGYYCIDNMPPALIQNFIQLGKADIEKAAFVVDIRGGEFFDDLKACLQEMKDSGVNYKIMFLEASDEVLIRRYSATRRSHPLSDGGSVQEGIQKEWERLQEIHRMADYIIDTSSMKGNQLQEAINALLMSGQEAERFSLTIQSFGFKHGIPLDADMVFDARFIPNPFYLASMRNLTGNSRKVQEYVLKFPETQRFIGQAKGMIDDLIPNFMREGKYHLVVAFGCTGGQHRSVTLANEFTRLFSQEGRRVLTIHRDL